MSSPQAETLHLVRVAIMELRGPSAYQVLSDVITASLYEFERLDPCF